MNKRIIKLISFDSGVGSKYSLKLNLEGEEAPKENKKAIGVQFYTKKLKMFDNDIKIILWDASGEERFKYLMENYSKGKEGAIILFDITSSDSFKGIPEWIEIIRKIHNSPPIVLVGVKVIKALGVKSYLEVNRDDIINIIKDEKVNAYFKITARTSIVLDNIIEYFAALILYNSGEINEVNYKSILDKVVYTTELIAE